MRSETSATDELITALHAMLKESNEECRRAAVRAMKRGCAVEAVIHKHMAARFMSVVTWEDLRRVLAEVRELASWLPVPSKQRKLTFLERKASSIAFIRSLDIDPEAANSLMTLVTESPGRPPESRRVAVPALEMRNKGAGWADIEMTLLPHRPNVINPGVAVRSEVHLLKLVLEKYRVQLGS